MAKATKIFFDMMHENTTKVMLFGDACPNVTGPLARTDCTGSCKSIYHMITTTTAPAIVLDFYRIAIKCVHCQ
jgi:hypothetical protein